MHAIYHNGPSSFHAFSSDGVSWTAPSTTLFNTTVALAPSPSESMAQRHRDPSRPSLLRANSGDVGCASDSDCSLLGSCAPNGECRCLAGWTGSNCGTLRLVPIANVAASTVWPAAGVPNSSSWGFTTVYDPVAKVYHAVADVSCGCSAHSSVRECTEYTGVLASGGWASSLVHLTSTRPDGGFVFAGVIAPATSFNPHLARSPEGTYALYFRVNAADALPMCSGDPAGPSTSASSLIKVCSNTSAGSSNCIHAGDSERGTNVYVATAASMAGPWKVQPVTVAGEGNLHISNPSVTFVKAGTPAAKLGRVAMAFRYNGPHGENNGIAYADTPAGPFNAVANLTLTPGPDAPTLSGPVMTLTRRERPELLFDAAGTPTVLYSGASSTDATGIYKAYSLAQQVSTSVKG